MARDRTITPVPTPFTELQRVEAQCDDRHHVYSRHHAKANGRLQQLFGDDDTKTPGLLNALQKGQEELSTGLKEVKKKVHGLEFKLAGISSLVMILVQIAYHFATK